MLSDADRRAVTEFTRIARMIYPRLVWEELMTEAGKSYLLVTDGIVSWFVEPVPQGWGVIAAHLGDRLLAASGTPAGALQGAIEQLRGFLECAAVSATGCLNVDRQLEELL